jgi:hypothetical protein
MRFARDVSFSEIFRKSWRRGAAGCRSCHGEAVIWITIWRRFLNANWGGRTYAQSCYRDYVGRGPCRIGTSARDDRA